MTNYIALTYLLNNMESNIICILMSFKMAKIVCDILAISYSLEQKSYLRYKINFQPQTRWHHEYYLTPKDKWNELISNLLKQQEDLLMVKFLFHPWWCVSDCFYTATRWFFCSEPIKCICMSRLLFFYYTTPISSSISFTATTHASLLHQMIEESHFWLVNVLVTTTLPLCIHCESSNHHPKCC